MIDSVQLEDVSCPLGCAKGDDFVLTGRDLLHNLPGEFTIVKCRSCNLMRTNPRPTSDAIGAYYPDNYGPYLSTQMRHAKPPSGVKRLLRPLIGMVFNFNTALMPRLAPGRLLEVGCASGAFLRQMASVGWQVEGIEFSAKAAQTAAELGYRVHAGALETAPQPRELYDLVVGWMVLEHLHDPVGGLQKLNTWVKPGAYLILSIPNARSLDFRLFGNLCYANHLPNHLYHFTPQTLQRVLDASGWKLEKISHQRVLSNLIGSIGYVLRDKGFNGLGQILINFPERAGRWHFVLYPLAWCLSIFGQTGRMTVWARKK